MLLPTKDCLLLPREFVWLPCAKGDRTHWIFVMIHSKPYGQTSHWICSSSLALLIIFIETMDTQFDLGQSIEKGKNFPEKKKIPKKTLRGSPPLFLPKKQEQKSVCSLDKVR